MRGVAFLVLAFAPLGALAAEPLVVSPAPETVSVTVYRDPGRSFKTAMNLGWLGGYALVTETRTLDLPAGTSDIRFEGVADTLIPASVIVRGLPAQPVEKNYDARLLSPGALVDAYLGRQVHVRRTNRKTGKVTETEAIVRSGPDGIVLQTAAGVEALSCTGLPETLIYRGVPQGVSDKPTLAIRAGAAQPTRATVQLSYLATQFDWQANYVAGLAPDGRTLDLFAWLTLANGNEASFPSAQAQAVAGKPHREHGVDEGQPQAVSPEIQLQCWPAGTTTSGLAGSRVVDSIVAEDIGLFPSSAIVVTGARAKESFAPAPPPMVAQQEELGDLKLYRVPERVTVAANAQKQVALLAKERVPFDKIYQLKPDAAAEVEEPEPIPIVLRMKNTKERGLGLPLPSGSVALFAAVDGRSMLVGEPGIDDKAIGEDVELEVGESPDVTYTQKRIGRVEDDRERDRPQRYELELANARPSPVIVEVELRLFGRQQLLKPSRRLGTKNGRHFWRVVVPANDRMSLTYTVDPEPTAKGEGE